MCVCGGGGGWGGGIICTDHGTGPERGKQLSPSVIGRFHLSMSAEDVCQYCVGMKWIWMKWGTSIFTLDIFFMGSHLKYTNYIL